MLADELALRVNRLSFVANQWNICCCLQQDSSRISLIIKLKSTWWLTYDCLNGTIESSVHTDDSKAFGAHTHGLFLSLFHGALELNNRTKMYYMSGLKKSKCKFVQMHVIQTRVWVDL